MCQECKKDILKIFWRYLLATLNLSILTTPRHLLQQSTSPQFFATKNVYKLFQLTIFKSLQTIPFSQLFGKFISNGSAFFLKLAALYGLSVSNSNLEAVFGREVSFLNILFSCFLCDIRLLAEFRLKFVFSLIIVSMCSVILIVWCFSSFNLDQNALPISLLAFFSCMMDHIVRIPILCKETICKI